MNRLIACLMIVGFVAQQFACCCAEASPSTARSGRQATVAAAAKTQKRCCKHHDHGRVSKTTSATADELPLQSEHQHHVCVGTHIFFRSVERFDVSQFVISPSLSLAVAPAVELLPTSAVYSTRLTDEDAPLCRALSRPALGVYQI